MLRFEELSCFSRHNASRRSNPKFSGAFSFLIRLASSWNVTSRTQCSEFSTDQWLRAASFSSLASAGKLLREYRSSTPSDSPMKRSLSTSTTLPRAGHSSPPPRPQRAEGRPHPPRPAPATPLGPLPVVMDAAPLPPVGTRPVEEGHDLLEEVLVVALQSQQVVGLALPDRPGDLLLASHGVDRHDRPGDLQHLQELRDGGDLV